jgi:hypothetical protein
MPAGTLPYALIFFGVRRAREDLMSTSPAAAMISDRSTGTTVIPAAWSNFSLARIVWNAAGRVTLFTEQPRAPTLVKCCS